MVINSAHLLSTTAPLFSTMSISVKFRTKTIEEITRILDSLSDMNLHGIFQTQVDITIKSVLEQLKCVHRDVVKENLVSESNVDTIQSGEDEFNKPSSSHSSADADNDRCDVPSESDVKDVLEKGTMYLREYNDIEGFSVETEKSAAATAEYDDESSDVSFSSKNGDFDKIITTTNIKDLTKDLTAIEPKNYIKSKQDNGQNTPDLAQTSDQLSGRSSNTPSPGMRSFDCLPPYYLTII